MNVDVYISTYLKQAKNFTCLFLTEKSCVNIYLINIFCNKCFNVSIHILIGNAFN